LETAGFPELIFIHKSTRRHIQEDCNLKHLGHFRTKFWELYKRKVYNLQGIFLFSLGLKPQHALSNSSKNVGYFVRNATLTLLVGHPLRTPLLESTAMNRMIDGCDSFLLS
jgi:hypothetical protein